MKLSLQIAAFILLTSIILLPPKTPGEKFIHYVNTYQKDSLQQIITPGFVYKYGFVDYKHDYNSFINQYINLSKSLEADFVVIKKLPGKNPEKFHLRDNGNYFKYLEVTPPEWIISIHTDDAGMIDWAQLDTVQGYAKYVAEITPKNKKFENWLGANFKEDLNIMVTDTTGLYSRRLKEYYNTNH